MGTKKDEQREKDLRAIAWMIEYHIDSGDWYSDYDNIKHLDYYVVRDAEFGDILAYILWTDAGDCIRGLRSGVRRANRGQGLAVRLYKRLKAYAKRQGKPYKTYCALTNIPSLNAHFKAGMKIEKIREHSDFTEVHLTT